MTSYICPLIVRAAHRQQQPQQQHRPHQPAVPPLLLHQTPPSHEHRQPEQPPLPPPPQPQQQHQPPSISVMTRRVGLDMLAQAAQRAGPRVFPTAVARGQEDAAASSSLSRAQDAMVTSYISLANQGLADSRKTTNFLRTCHAYATILGADPTNGLQETASWATRSGKLAELPGTLTVGYPEWMTATDSDETACRAWSACIGNRDIVLFANTDFSRLYLSSDEMRDYIRDTRLMCFYVWSRMVVPEELQKFYHAFIDVVFKHSLAKSFVVVKCLNKLGEQKRCLVELAYHCSQLPDGRPITAYQVQLWPLGHRSLPAVAAAPRPVVQLT